jgi:hypothetical protein
MRKARTPRLRSAASPCYERAGRDSSPRHRFPSTTDWRSDPMIGGEVPRISSTAKMHFGGGFRFPILSSDVPGIQFGVYPECTTTRNQPCGYHNDQPFDVFRIRPAQLSQLARAVTYSWQILDRPALLRSNLIALKEADDRPCLSLRKARGRSRTGMGQALRDLKD